jgi:hypothetical protein
MALVLPARHAKIILRPMAKVFPFSSLPTADLVIDAVYEGGTKGSTADDFLGKLIPGAGNQGGFRAIGSWDAPRLVILYSSMDDADRPDFIDLYTRDLEQYRELLVGKSDRQLAG